MGIVQRVLSFLRYVGTAIMHAVISIVARLTTSGPARVFIEFLLARPLTKDTAFLIVENWPILLDFLVDLAEPLKRAVPADSEDGSPPQQYVTEYLPYSELDLSVAMNRHAVVCQVQRLLKSFIPILSNWRTNLTELELDTVLESDRAMTCDVKELEVPKDPSKGSETWLFVNGICNEYHWTVLAINKLARRFFNYSAKSAHTNGVDIPSEAPSPDHNSTKSKTKLKGIFNRSDGILWDIIECSSQLDLGLGHSKSATEVTASSKTAQKLLREQLKAALENDDQQKQILMIAHSQGCLVLRLAFRDFQNQKLYPDLYNLLPRMRTHLTVYTFGNPAFEWQCHELVRHTEHFANTQDFVARLGVLGSLKRKFYSPARGIYHCEACEKNSQNPGTVEDHPQMLVWENEMGRGHLFGSQYSLDQKDYRLVFPRGSNSGLASELLSRNVGVDRDGE